MTKPERDPRAGPMADPLVVWIGADPEDGRWLTVGDRRHDGDRPYLLLPIEEDGSVWVGRYRVEWFQGRYVFFRVRHKDGHVFKVGGPEAVLSELQCAAKSALAKAREIEEEPDES